MTAIYYLSKPWFTTVMKSMLNLKSTKELTRLLIHKAHTTLSHSKPVKKTQWGQTS